MELLPPRIANPELFALVGDMLAVDAAAADNAKLRLRLIDENMSWQALVDLADAQGVLAPFVWALMRRSLLLPVSANSGAAADHPTSRLTATYQADMDRRQRQRDQLAGVIAALNRREIEPLLLKGARYLLAPPRSWGEARDMRDIDVLIHPDDAARAVEALTVEGYTADTTPVPMDQHLPEMWRAGCPSVVELHIEALAFSARKILATDEVWRRGLRQCTEHGDFFMLPAEWHLLHGLLNHQISDRGHVRGILAVKPLWEFAMLGSELSAQGWRDIADHMAARGQADVLGSWIVQAARLYGFAPPHGIEISDTARRHAAATFANTVAPDWLRRGRFLADQFRFSFAKDTLAARYQRDPQDVSLLTAGRHLRFLSRHYRGRVRERLFGNRDRAS